MEHRVKKIITLMKEYLHKGWSASRLAQFVNISPSRLHQLFKDETGLPPARYLHLLRMEQAKELLEASYLSVKEVMAKVGVTDESHFVRDFKKRYGFTPAKYREQFQNARRRDNLELEERRPNSTADSVRPSVTRKTPAAVAPPPLLLRRASHPRHLSDSNSPLLRTRKRRELLSLLKLRHAAFAALTANITSNLARGLTNVRSIFYRARRSTLYRRLPTAMQRTRAR